MTPPTPPTPTFKFKPLERRLSSPRPKGAVTAPSPAKARLRLPDAPPEQRGRRKGRRGNTYTTEQETTAQRCRDAGMNKKETATAAGLTLQQVHYLWYVKKSQAKRTKAKQAERVPLSLSELVPEPITHSHRNTLPGHTYGGQVTQLRTDLIDQVKSCRNTGHKLPQVAEHFNLKPSTVRYIWYQLPGCNKKIEQEG